MLALASIAISLVASAYGFRWARRYFSRRLRFVDSAHGSAAPFVAAGLVTLVALPITWLPFLEAVTGFGTALSVGVAVGLGVASASREVRIASYRVDR